MTSVTYPDGSLYTTSAQSQKDIDSVWQDTVCQLLGYNLKDNEGYAQVRVGWLVEGQPYMTVNDDIVFVRCNNTDTEFSRLRNAVLAQNDDPLKVSVEDIHTKTWTCIVTLYGPNSSVNASLIVSGLLNAPFVDDFLASYKLYINPHIEQPQRVPELFQAQWWERSEIKIEFNEEVTDTFTVGTVGSVVVTTYDRNGQLTTQTITE